jgi:chemotaxis receptor (MCP) glutamine deamidase CheD
MAPSASPAPWAHGFASTPPEAQTYVHPGRTFVTADATPLVTVVGTGAVVCLWDNSKRVGGFAHFLLPEAGTAPPAPRYGDVALKALVAELVALGANPRTLRARVFGGCAPPISSDSGHLGERNVAAAAAFLQAQAIPVLERDVGGKSARKIVFDPRFGSATVTRVGG